MMVTGLARSRQRLIRERIKTGAARNVIRLRVRADRTPPGHVQTEFNAARMKAQSPIKRPTCPEVVPFDADPEAIEVAIQLPPALWDGTPGATLRFIDGKHRANLTGVAAANASEV